MLTIAANCVPAALHAREVVRTEQVHYSDLNLATPEGVAMLDRRLSRAVRKVCADNNFHSTWEDRGGTRCMQDAQREVRRQRDIAINLATNPVSQIAQASVVQ
ncbi:UrcA family protein [Novosphingobium sp. PhB165]|uniref:UrcA family protein n=1 Tax=Novosphingobium sp. PhB165 TaxID=2485105 RepID=UPI001404993D|nr:UrcA family protein [Novosphingobium sp. PhB165]